MKWRGILLATYCGFAFFILALPNSVFATELKYDYYGIVTQTLTKDKSPYIVRACAQTIVKGWSTLTIEAGTVLKFEQAKTCSGSSFETRLLVDGGLIINGTEADPVVFTSIYDDSVSGDTDGDGGVTQPRMADYKFTEINSNNNNLVKIDHAVIKYAEIGLYIGSGVSQISIDRSEFAYNGMGIVTYSSNSVNASKFYGNNYAASAYDWTLFTRPQLTAINNWWGDDSGPTDTRNPGGKGQRIMGNVIYDPWMRMAVNNAPVLSFSTDTPEGVVSKTTFLPAQPVFRVVYSDADGDVPVYLKVVTNSSTFDFATSTGSGFVSGTVYSFTPPTGTLQKGIYSFHFEASDGKFTTRLPVSGELNLEVKNTPTIVIPGILGSEQKNGVWVMDPILHTYDNLLDTLRVNGFTDNVDLFPFPYDWHQSNVLTGFQLHQKIEDVKILCNCNKVNLVAHSMGGLVSRQYIQSDYYQNDVDQMIFMGTPHLGAPEAYLVWEGGELGKGIINGITKYIFSREAKKLGYNNLLDYVRKSVESEGQLLPTFSYLKKQDILKIYPNEYPVNNFLDNLNSSLSKLYTKQISILNIVGVQGLNSTIQTIRVIDSPYLPLWEHGYPDGYYGINNPGSTGSIYDFGLYMGDGDGTVTLGSSSFIDNNIVKIQSSHGDLPTESSGLILKQITGLSNPKIIDKLRYNNYKYLIIKILSPADIVIIAPDGKKIGKDFSNNNEVNEVGGAFYSGFETDDEYITIPNPLDGQYRIETKGTGNGGEYTLVTGFVSDATTTEREITGHILPDQITGVDVSVNSSLGQIDSLIPLDNEPPKINVVSPSSSDYLRSDVFILNVTSTDFGTGIYSQEISLDGTMIQNESVLDLFNYKLGYHTITVTSTDMQNNASVSSTVFRIIATPLSTISDIERCYELGWIKNRKSWAELIKVIKKYLIINYEHERKEMQKHKHLLKNKDWAHKAKELTKTLDVLLRRKYINQQAHDILSEDIDWLIKN